MDMMTFLWLWAPVSVTIVIVAVSMIQRHYLNKP